MSAMKAFYGKTLDLRIMDERPDRFSVEAGETRMTFVSSTDTVDGRPPFYHFAFNIPENKILKALEWQKARTPMLSIPERNRAAGYPPEVVDYSHWNAHSVFFLDPAGNVVEYIARHDLKNSDSQSVRLAGHPVRERDWPDCRRRRGDGGNAEECCDRRASTRAEAISSRLWVTSTDYSSS